MTQDVMNDLVPKKLKKIEDEYDIKILLAVESGSRAWGFASPDSDFDVRFIYKRPRNKYLELNPNRDVIELPINDTWDINGWDLNKTLILLYKSNPTLFEWFGSPIRYYKTDFCDEIKPLLTNYFSVKNTLHHYLSTAKHDYKQFLQSETVNPKKYFYALRPILACNWILEHETPPPVLFDTLCKETLPIPLKSTIDYLLDIKINNPEKTTINAIPYLNGYLKDNFFKFDDILKNMPNGYEHTWSLGWEPLNEFFIKNLETF